MSVKVKYVCEIEYEVLEDNNLADSDESFEDFVVECIQDQLGYPDWLLNVKVIIKSSEKM